ncbi:hypothetical protein Y032_0014g2315 [Ancylostoma ceylanicum]|uniref:Uncharacterized protein n=1 Tax=Ancylostoma ceylanicum TaxID=53326 RepID=A0A016VBK5_9BILA|nr:hypothetical protein Y032_0014g2315 [Ancylostoma ceylanicum]
MDTSEWTWREKKEVLTNYSRLSWTVTSFCLRNYPQPQKEKKNSIRNSGNVVTKQSRETTTLYFFVFIMQSSPFNS